MPNDNDTFLEAARSLFEDAFREMRDCLDLLSTDQLNWRPSGREFNSLAVLAVHSLGSTRSWLSIAAGVELPQRDREAEFRAEAESLPSLFGWAAAAQGQCLAILSRGPSLPWAEMRPTHARPDANAATEVSGAWALMHALEHLREHLGQMLLTRQLMGS
jgi:uncharacterized damage-inducible protein DinB